MNWIVLSGISAIFSAFQTVASRGATRLNVPIKMIVLTIFLALGICSLVVAIVQGDSLVVTGTPLIATITAALLGSLLGSMAATTSTLLAPNPGYALSLENNSTIIVVLASPLFFHDPLSIHKFLGIIVILASCACITLEKRATRLRTSSKWIFLAAFSSICFGTLILLSRFIFNSGVSPFTFLAYDGLIVAALLLVDTCIHRDKFKYQRNHLLMLAGAAVFTCIYNLLTFQAFKIAPNAGYVSAVVATSAALATVIAIFLFKDHFSARKLCGVLGVVAGLIVMFI